MKYLLLLPLFLLCSSASAIPPDCETQAVPCDPEPGPSRQFRTFAKPVIEGGRLDWCLNWATNCGRPAADAYCESRGYDGATSFAIDNDIGYTKLLTGAVCSAAHCDGFLRVTCVKTLW